MCRIDTILLTTGRQRLIPFMENGHVHLHVMKFVTINNVKNLKIKECNSSFL